MDLLIQAKLDMYLHCLKQTWFQKVFPSAVQCAVPTRASGTQQQQARLVLAWEQGGGRKGAAGPRSAVVVERVQQSTDQANNLLQLIHISRNIYQALPHSSPSEGPKPLMFGLVPPCPRAPGTAIRCGWLVTFTLNQWLPPGIHRHLHKPQHLHGVSSALPSHCSILAHVSVQWLAVLYSVSPKGEPHFQPFSYTVVGLWLPCFRLQPAPMETLVGKRGLPKPCPCLSYKA